MPEVVISKEAQIKLDILAKSAIQADIEGNKISKTIEQWLESVIELRHKDKDIHALKNPFLSEEVVLKLDELASNAGLTQQEYLEKLIGEHL